MCERSSEMQCWQESDSIKENLNMSKQTMLEWRFLPKRHYSKGDFQSKHEMGDLLTFMEDISCNFSLFLSIGLKYEG